MSKVIICIILWFIAIISIIIAFKVPDEPPTCRKMEQKALGNFTMRAQELTAKDKRIATICIVVVLAVISLFILIK